MHRVARLAARVSLALAVLGCSILLGLVAFVPARAVELPPDFVAENFVPGDAFIVPTTLAFLPDGRLLVGEKRGVLWVVQDGVRKPVPMWSRPDEVLDDGDRGLLGVAVDPDFATNRFIYLLYTVDPDSNGIDMDDDAFGRLTRYQVSVADPDVVDPATRTILMGTSWRDGPIIGSITHTVGALRWGADGSLLVSTGDGAQYSVADAGGLDAPMFAPGRADPYEDVGAFRSQSVNSLAGKILRLNPANGHGYASNPFADGNLRSARSRVWAYGLRNPFRFRVRPGTGVADTAQGRPGTVFLGDVGWATWEELDIIRTGGANLGWPCREGSGIQPAYAVVSPSHGGCDSVGTPENPSAMSDPAAAWHHTNASLSVPPGFYGNASVGGIFYQGTLYPPAYQGRYFFGDYGANWLRTAIVDTSDALVGIQAFGEALQGPVEFAAEPVTGDIVYVSILTGQVRRLRYGAGTPTNGPPIAVAAASPDVGLAPLSVTFSSAGSLDPDGGPVTFAWAFGDQTGSTLANPVHAYATPGSYTAVLTVTDTTGALARDSVRIIVAAQIAFPSTAVLDSFARADGPVGAPWAGTTSVLTVAGGQLATTAQDAWGVWDGAVFGPTQEVFVTLGTISPSAPEHDLMLKVQGTDWRDGYIEVRYDVTLGTLSVSTYLQSTGWVLRGGPWAESFAAGDSFGARAYANGTIEVYKNGVAIHTCAAGDWPFAASGGRIGLLTWNATASRFDDFGGGDAVLDLDTPPQVTITSPLDGAFFVEGDTIRLTRTVSDAQDPVDSLVTHWSVNLIHNNHTHPDTYSSDSSGAWFVAENHDDGTGTWYEIVCVATDLGGKRDTALARIWPEVDLTPAGLRVDPAQPGSGSPLAVSFQLHNLGRMPAPTSRWVLSDGVTTLAQGDTLVPALDSVAVTVMLTPGLAAGSHTLRVTTDSLGAVVETDESNGSTVLGITVVEGTVGAEGLPAALALSGARPNPTVGPASFALELPRASRVAFTVYDLQGREVWRRAPDRLAAGRWELVWPGTGPGGQRLGAGLYLARVSVDGVPHLRRVALLR